MSAIEVCTNFSLRRSVLIYLICHVYIILLIYGKSVLGTHRIKQNMVSSGPGSIVSD